MTIAEWSSYFDLIQDKYQAPYFTEAEKNILFNRSIVDFVVSKLPPTGDGDNVELSQDSVTAIEPLIYALPYQTMTTAGLVTRATLTTALQALATGAVLWRPMSIGWKLGNSNHPVKFTRLNDWWEFKRNYFKNPTNDNPRVYTTYTDFRFEPVNTSAKLYFTVLKYPKTVAISGPAVDCDLPDFTHNDILAVALEKAGVASRDEALAQLIQTQKNVYAK
jgi:hypothetical protein